MIVSLPSPEIIVLALLSPVIVSSLEVPITFSISFNKSCLEFPLTCAVAKPLVKSLKSSTKSEEEFEL